MHFLPGLPKPLSGQGTLPGGASLLKRALITGQTIVMPAAWGILLPRDRTTPPAQNAPCVNAENHNARICILMQGRAEFALFRFLHCNSFAGFSCNLAVSPTRYGPTSCTGFHMQGTIIATQSGSVSAVATTIDINACGLGGVGGLANCVFHQHSRARGFHCQRSRRQYRTRGSSSGGSDRRPNDCRDGRHQLPVAPTLVALSSEKRRKLMGAGGWK